MSVIQHLIAPIPLAFTVIIVGYGLGKIKLCGVSLELSGVLITAVITGWLLTLIDIDKGIWNTPSFGENLKCFSDLGTALFVSVIGISTGYSLKQGTRKEIPAVGIGSMMVVSAFITMRVIGEWDTTVSVSQLLGALCGALTTTPGLSAACEREYIVPEELISGYGCAYFSGVTAVVLFVQIAVRKSVKGVENGSTDKAFCDHSAMNGIIQTGVVILLGRLIGGIEVCGFSLGDSGGMLCVGIAAGTVIQKHLPKKSVSEQSMQLLRSLGLVLFFVGNGIPAGMRLGAVEFRLLLYGIMMSLIAIAVGAVLCRLAFRDSVAAVVAGGMTSTPAVAALMQKQKDVPLSRYSFAYVGALITIIVLMRAVPVAG